VKFNRRRFLLASSSTLLPALGNALFAEAAGLRPKRLILILSTNGLQTQMHVPAGLPSAPGDYPLQLAEALSAFEPYKQDMLLLHPLTCPLLRGQHGNGWAASTMVYDIYDPNLDAHLPGGISFDRFIAQTLSAGLPNASLNLATIWDQGSWCHRSADGPRLAFPAEPNPLQAYRRIFGAGLSPSETALDRELSLLDFVADDTKLLATRLGATERAKLEQYVDSMRTLELQLQTTADLAGCAMTQMPETLDKMGNSTRCPEDVIDGQIGVAYQALACGLTNVVTLNFGAGEIVPFGAQFDATTIYDLDAHTMFHNEDWEIIRKYHSHVFGKMAGLWKRLKETPEASGSMADDTIMVYLNDMGGKHHNGWDHYVGLVVGGAGVIKTNRYVQLPTTGETAVDSGDPLPVHTMGEFFLGVAHALGVTATSFGDPLYCPGPLPQLLG
jgi:hypothetical protein